MSQCLLDLLTLNTLPPPPLPFHMLLKYFVQQFDLFVSKMMISFLDHQRFIELNNFQKSHLKITKIHFGNNHDKIIHPDYWMGKMSKLAQNVCAWVQFFNENEEKKTPTKTMIDHELSCAATVKTSFASVDWLRMMKKYPIEPKYTQISHGTKLYFRYSKSTIM